MQYINPTSVSNIQDDYIYMKKYIDVIFNEIIVVRLRKTWCRVIGSPNVNKIYIYIDM